MIRFAKSLSNRRQDLGMTQAELAQRMNVTRQTVSRWESGAAYPDIEKVVELSEILGISCDRLLLGDPSAEDADDPGKLDPAPAITRCLTGILGKLIRLDFFDGEEDMELLNVKCIVESFEGGFIKVRNEKKSQVELVPIAAIRAMEIMEEN